MLHKKSDHSSALQSLSRLYREIDGHIARLAKIHAGRMRCRPGCADCCVDDISVNEAEALNIRRSFTDLLYKELPHPEGACAFLSGDKTCRIYPMRPYVCRTQGLPLHWIEEHDGKTTAMRDICPLNEHGTPVEELPENECWRIGPVEEELALLQNKISNGTMRRVKLRELFAPNARPCR
jgi:uncharacterized protein